MLLTSVAQVGDSVYSQNLKSLKNCDEPFSLDIHPIQIRHAKALKRDTPIINILNQFETLDYKKYKKLVRRLKKDYGYQNNYLTDSLNFKLSVEQCKLSNNGYASLYIRLYLDNSNNILYKYFILQVGNQGNDSKYFKLLLPFIKVKLNFKTCNSAQNGFGDKNIQRFTETLPKEILVK